jgi:hypothetical protein
MRTTILGLALCVSIGSQPSSIPNATTIPATFDRDISGDRLMVPVTVNGRAFPCHLDSGGGALLALDQKAAERAGLRATGLGSSAGAGATATPDSRLEGATIGVAGVVVRNATVIVRPFEPEAPEFECLLGLTLLRDYVVELNYIKPHLRLHDPTGFEPPRGAVAIPFTLEQNHPLADMTLILADGERVRARVMLDTGAAYYGAVLLKPFIAAHNVMARAGKVARRPQAGSHAIRMLAARPLAISLGPVQVLRPVIALLETDTPFLRMDGLLGEGFFVRFDVTFDYRRHTLWLAPNERFGEEQWFDASGVGFVKTPDAKRHVAAAIVPGSPADIAGVRKGDVLVSIDSEPADGLTSKQVALALSREGSSRVLALRREGRRITLTLRLVARL